MKLLMIHSDYFKSEVTEKGRAPIIEEVNDANKIIEVQEGLIIFMLVEKMDENKIEEIIQKATKEVLTIIKNLKTSKIVLIPFAHLFGEPAKATVAIEALKKIQKLLIKEKLDISRLPFGWFNKIDIKMKGHPLSRIAREIRV